MNDHSASIFRLASRPTAARRPIATSARILASTALAALACASVVTAQSQESAPPSKPPAQERGMPAMPATPSAVTELVEVIPFELASPFTHGMRKERPEYTRGHILVLRAPEAYLIPRQVAEPVLIVGAQTAERINTGMGSGLLVVVVPEWTERVESDVAGEPAKTRVGDPATARIWFATPELPERVDAAWIEAESAKAGAANVAPQAPRAASFASAKPRAFADRDALGRMLADLVERHAPTESERIEALRAVD